MVELQINGVALKTYPNKTEVIMEAQITRQALFDEKTMIKILNE